MLCFWGAQIREGLGLVKPDQVKHGNSGIRSVCPKTAVQDMSAGRSFAGFIRDGRVSVLRLRSEDRDGKLKQLQLKNDRIRLIVCGGDGAVLLSDSGKVLIVDKVAEHKPLKGLDNRQVIQIACGDHHSMALTNDGQVFVWGENSHGQLGLRKDHPSSPSAQHVQSLSGIPLAQISAGGDHSFVLSLSGVVFGWGRNSAGQLGLGDTTDRHVPAVVNSLNLKKTVSISCGAEHTATLSKGGTVFTFGSGGSGQLGHNSFRDEHHPRVVAELWGSEVSQVTCGRHYTLVSVVSSKLIYSFGCGMQGQLGNREMITQSVPFPVDLTIECNHEYMIEKLIAGEKHSFALFFKKLGDEFEQPKSNPSREILTLNDRMIDRWLSGSDANSLKVIKKDINTVFSSPASLNGSFLKISRDEHYQTSEEHCGLDFDLVKTSFAKLSENKSLISEVIMVVEQMLHSLNPNPVGVEALRVYLLLPELIRHLKKQQRTKLTEALASKILQLDPDALKVLETYWSKLPDDRLQNLVDLFQKVSAMLIDRIASEDINWDIPKRLQNLVQILHMVYKVCCSTNRIIKSDFIIHEINDLLDVVREGLGLVKPDQVKHGKCGIRSVWLKSKVQDMSAGRSFVAFIQDGKVSVLRLCSEDGDHDGKPKTLELKNDRIRLIVCGEAGAVLLAYGGKVLIMDKSTVCRSLKGLDNRQVIQIACGDHHSMALTNDGQVFVWGENSHGQLGLRKDHPGSPSAQHVQSLSGIPLAQISAGGDHSFVLSLSGVVFGWGRNSAGQLGLGDTTDRHVPTVVNSLNLKKTVSISCGAEHTATLSKGGTVFTFGSGGSGQLGHNSFRDEHHPRMVAELWGSEVSQVTCGRHYTLVSVASSKLIYSFGCGMQGQLGNREMITQSVPFPVDLTIECNHEYMIEKLIAGENHSFALFLKKLGDELEQPKSNPSRDILTLNDRMIDRWLSGSDANSLKAIKKDINTVFSSPASLNGSFLKISRDEHYQTSEEHCGLDFDLVKTSFAKLSENKSLISEVKMVVEQMLRSLNPNPVGVEALRVYLLLPELIRHLKKQQRTKLTEALASKILQLDPDALKVLETYWSKLPDDRLQNLVDLFQNVSAMLIDRIASEDINWDIPKRLQNLVQILHMVYKVCCSTNRIIKSDFIIHEINDLLDVVREGLGLVKPDQVKHGKCGIRSVWLKSKVQDMSAGRSFVAFIRDGKVSVLRLCSEDGDHDGKPKTLELKNDRIRLIVCGEAGAVLLAYGGKVLIMDKSTVCRSLKGLDNRQVIQIACGDHHSMALTNNGQVFVWGENSHGQLGLRKDHPGSPSAQHVQSLSGIPLAQISAGGDHSFVLSLSGVVFGWGRNSAGQLGLGDTTDRHVPTMVNSLNRKKTVSISCGGEHTATLSKGGTVFTFGSGGSGQLGHNSFRDEHHPRVVAELWGSEVSQVTCGRHHTLVSVVSSKLIYSFGCGMQGQLGNREMITQSVPFPVDLTIECNHEYMIEKLIAGENHSFALFLKKLGDELEQPKSNPSREILTLNDRMIDRWLSGSDANSLKDINTVFSSPASLNGSFLKKSCDDHYQTSEEHCGLDFDLVKKSFAKLSENKSLISEIVHVVEQMLRSLNPKPVGVEALRVYLLLPELIRHLQKHQRNELTEALASKILQLNPDALRVLKMYWSKLPDDWLKVLVKLFRKVSADFIGRIAAENMIWDIITRLPKFVKILQMVYQVCCSANRNIAKSDFIINEINDLLDVLQTTNEDVINNWGWFNWTGQIHAVKAQQTYYNTVFKNLISLPCIFNLEAKCSYMKNRVWKGCFPLTLRRTALLEDSFYQLRTATQEQLREFWLSVFYTEDMRKTDVNKRDFFHNIFKELCVPESQLLVCNDNQTMMWFPTQLSVEKEKYFLFGILCGLAFNNNSVVHLPFPLALFKKLLNVKPSLEDLTEFDPGLGTSLQYILDYSDDVEEMDMNFTVTWDKTEVELDPAEPGKMVTNYNRTEFVDKYVDYILNKSVQEAFEEFKRGFFKACDKCMVEMFEPEELRGVLVGNEEYDWDILKQNTTYEGSFYAEHPIIISFWEVFDELTSNEKKTFLLFLTGFEKVPILGMSAVKMRVRPLFSFTQDHLPEALTCHALLDLPVYQNKETLKAKLIEAINHKRGFWEE
ncbi:uncharacterized protein LOC131537051 isoform X2 [Onychostoma macrolepis]|uniref:uncharacterized protein LOC131537051 isoform X2 n=1 Tax=Onychostoma macrolepis TaxID=369639 RepID=UPI00272A06EC|nr:uncharacterized protein LOC131537051 isoform X2 [Onychostoma macrolepis]